MKDLQACTASPFGSCAVRTLAVAAGIVFLLLAFNLVHPDHVVITASFTLSVWLARRFLDRQSFRSLGLEPWNLDDLIKGFAAVLIPLLFVVFIQSLAGWAILKGWGMAVEVPGSLLSTFIIAGLTAWREELLFRGYLLDNMQRGTGWLWGILLSSILFGFLHIILSSNASSLKISQQFSIVAISFLAGLILAWARLRSGSLWMPMGFHLGWNFLITPVFGLNPGDAPMLMAWEFSGPVLLDRLWFLDFGIRSLFILLLAGGWITLVTHRRPAGPAPDSQRE